MELQWVAESGKIGRMPECSFAESIEWKSLKHQMGSRLREFPASLHTARQFLHAEREYGNSIDI